MLQDNDQTFKTVKTVKFDIGKRTTGDSTHGLTAHDSMNSKDIFIRPKPAKGNLKSYLMLI